MQKLANEMHKLAWRSAPDYPFKSRPFIRVTGEPSIKFRPFRKEQVEGIRRLTKDRLATSFKKHFNGTEFGIFAETLEEKKTFCISLYSDRLPTYIGIYTLPAEIEFNFKRSRALLTKSDRKRHLFFLREVLGEDVIGIV